jgi:hypothetical protein
MTKVINDYDKVSGCYEITDRDAFSSHVMSILGEINSKCIRPFHFSGFYSYNSEKALDSIEELFGVFEAKQNGENILYAENIENGSSFDESCWIVFEKNGKLYEINASHCSCYGYEGQWNPEETDVAFLRFRLDKGNLVKWTKGKEFIEWLDSGVWIGKTVIG